MKVGLQLIKNVMNPLAKSSLLPLRLTAAATVADADIHKKVIGLRTTTLMI